MTHVVRMVRMSLVAAFVVGGFLSAATAGASIDPSSASGVWLFEEGFGDTASDSSANGRVGVFTGNPSWTEGVFGGAIDLPGAGDTVMIEGFAMEFPTEDVTVVAWVKVSEVKNQDLFSLEPLQPGRITVHMPWDGGVHWQFGGGEAYAWLWPPDYQDEWTHTWQHFAFVHDLAGKQMVAYNGGVEAGSSPVANAFLPREGDFHIGGRLESSFAGAIDEFAIFDVALALDDIIMLKDEGLASVLGVGGGTAVKPSDKLASTWAALKSRR